MGRPRVALSGISTQVHGLAWEAAGRLRIGRQGALEAIIDDPSISNHHAEILHTPQGWVLHDLGSRTGTYLNNVRVAPGGQPVRRKDFLKVGNVLLQVSAVEGEPRKPAEPSTTGTCLKTSGSHVNLQATTRRAWEHAVEQIAHGQEERLLPVRRILPLLRAGHHLTQASSLDELLRTLLREVITVLDAQRGAIVLADDMTGALELRAAAATNEHISLKDCFSRTLADRCFLEGESLLCEDVNAEADLVGAQSIRRGSMSSIICALLRSPRRRLGVLHLDRGPFQEPFTTDDFDLVDAIACYVSVGIESAKLEQQRDLFLQAATTLAQAVELRDSYTGSHTQRVTTYALLLGEELGLSPAERQHIKIATPLHDIGKIAVPDSILRKPGKLTDDEFRQMREHAAKGAALLANIPGLAPMLPVVRNHHERWDGSGYPDGLAGEAIARVARVVAVADAFDAMTSHRPYRQALPLDVAFAELMAKAGSHFDPACVAAFVRLRPRIEALLTAGAESDRTKLT